MGSHKIVLTAMFCLAALGIVFAAARAGGQLAPGSAPTAQLTVSVEARHGTEVPVVDRRDVVISEGRDRDSVASWIPAQGDHAGLELLILIDDASSLDIATHFGELRAFMQAQPVTTLIGVGYMRFGMVQMLQEFTADHAAAGKVLRVTVGITGAGATPYFSLQDLMKHWPTNTVRPRHEILMVSDGIDSYYSGGPDDPYVAEAIGALQRVGVVVYTIYEPGAGHYGHSFWRINWGQDGLARVSDETGGESYNIGSTLGSAVTFSPYLDALTRQLQHQYLLTFSPKPQQKPGLQAVRVFTELSNVDLVAADKVYVPASPR